MTRDQRLARYQREIAEIAPVEFSFAIFEDVGRLGRVVQVANGTRGQPCMAEATNRYDADNPDLTPDQEARLAALGFETHTRPYPGRTVDLARPASVAELIDAAFLALGAAPDFTVGLYAAEAGERSWADDYP